MKRPHHVCEECGYYDGEQRVAAKGSVALARIALDAMGGDFAPKATIAGALHALHELDAAHTVQLVGQTTVIENTARRVFSRASSAQARRRSRPDRRSSRRRTRSAWPTSRPPRCARSRTTRWPSALKLQVDGKSDAFVSAGNTGAQMAVVRHAARSSSPASRDRRSPRYSRRRAIRSSFSTPARTSTAPPRSSFSSPGLARFTLNAFSAARILSIGLLNIGEEPEKGNAVAKEAHVLFQKAGFNFHGNVEGRDLPAGASDRGPLDVVVCDGFVGNVVLKFYEGVMPMIVRASRASTRGSTCRAREVRAAGASTPPSTAARRCSESRGVSIICHGNSPPRAIKNAINVAVRAVETQHERADRQEARGRGCRP